MNEIEQLKREIEELKNWKRSLESSHSIPLNIDQSFRERLNTGIGTDEILITGTGTPSTANISISGDPPYNFDVLTSSGTLKLTIDGVAYELLKK